jgi:hypothetical protein
MSIVSLTLNQTVTRSLVSFAPITSLCLNTRCLTLLILYPADASTAVAPLIWSSHCLSSFLSSTIVLCCYFSVTRHWWVYRLLYIVCELMIISFYLFLFPLPHIVVAYFSRLCFWCVVATHFVRSFVILPRHLIRAWANSSNGETCFIILGGSVVVMDFSSLTAHPSHRRHAGTEV